MDSAVCDGTVFESCQKQEIFFSSPEGPDRLWGPSTFLFNGYRGWGGGWGSFPGVKWLGSDVQNWRIYASTLLCMTKKYSAVIFLSIFWCYILHGRGPFRPKHAVSTFLPYTVDILSCDRLYFSLLLSWRIL